MSGLKVLPNYVGSMNSSCEKFAKKFKSPLLRYALTHIQPGKGNLYSMVFSYATVVIGNGGIPYGGARQLTLRMADRFTSLGGTLKTNTSVLHILTKNNKAVGVKLEDGRKIYGDYVVSCVDAGYTINKLLLRQYSCGYTKRFDNPEKYQCPSCCFVSLAIEDLPEFVSPLNFKVEPFKCGTREIELLNLRSYTFDKTFSKGNKQVCTVLLDQYYQDYDFWNQLYKNDFEGYKTAKQEIGNIVIDRIINRFPQLAGKITLLDVATPRTYTNYCNNTKGAYMAFLFNEKTGLYNPTGKIKGLRNFYIGSQWVQSPGGLPLALACGRFAIQRICKKENIRYLLNPSKVKTKKAVNKI
jgi:phytoene dehydrogenase-like protein